jgi:hypothetical protein
MESTKANTAMPMKMRFKAHVTVWITFPGYVVERCPALAPRTSPTPTVRILEHLVIGGHGPTSRHLSVK